MISDIALSMPKANKLLSHMIARLNHHQKSGVNSDAPEGKAVPVPLVAPGVLI
jgi:hypothetical protein